MATSGPGRRTGPATPARLTLGDLGLVALVTALVRGVSGAQRFTFLHTPDSEFYFSLGVFGSAVTDRAPVDGYYWTKLGIVLPVRALVGVVGLDPVTALDVFHVGLLLLVVGSGYVVARLHWSRLGSCVAAAFVALNTVVLGFLGDPYASGAALAGLFLLLATATAWTLGRRPFRWGLAAGMGLAAAWLVMVNPYAVVVGAAGCAGVLVANARAVVDAGSAALLRSLGALVGSLALGFGAFLALGWWVFPGLSWFDSLRSFLSSADLADWAAKDWAWLPSEITLLVPATGAVVAVVALAAKPRSRATRTGVGLVCLTIVVAIGYKLASESNVLEHSVYNSMLWPATLLALVLVASSTTEPAAGLAPLAVAVAAPLAWVAAGHWSAVVSTPAALFAVAGAVLAVGLLLLWGRTGRVVLSPSWPLASVGVVVLVLLGSLFQVLQNGRPQDPTKLHRRVLYSAAYLPNHSAALLAQDARIQSWLIGVTEPHEQLLVWNEAQTRSAASMQLWGPNSAGSGFGGPLGPAGMATIRATGPDAIVAYARELDTVAGIRAELEAEWIVVDPACETFPGDNVPAIEVCVLRLAAAEEGESP